MGDKYRWVKVADSIHEISFGSNDLAEVHADDKRICIGKYKNELLLLLPSARMPAASLLMVLLMPWETLSVLYTAINFAWKTAATLVAKVIIWNIGGFRSGRMVCLWAWKQKAFLAFFKAESFKEFYTQMVI